jgi:hypothetical protein
MYRYNSQLKLQARGVIYKKNWKSPAKLNLPSVWRSAGDPHLGEYLVHFVTHTQIYIR